MKTAEFLLIAAGVAVLTYSLYKLFTPLANAAAAVSSEVSSFNSTVSNTTNAGISNLNSVFPGLGTALGYLSMVTPGADLIVTGTGAL
jgi:hypothetical protein